MGATHEENDSFPKGKLPWSNATSSTDCAGPFVRKACCGVEEGQGP